MGCYRTIATVHGTGRTLAVQGRLVPDSYSVWPTDMEHPERRYEVRLQQMRTKRCTMGSLAASVDTPARSVDPLSGTTRKTPVVYPSSPRLLAMNCQATAVTSHS